MNLENLTNRERCLLRAIGMLKDRKNYYADACETPTISIIDGICETSNTGITDGMYQAYDSAVTILEYAWDENWEVLNQFDYFGEDETEERDCTPATVARESEVE